MEKEFRLVGSIDNISFDEPAVEPLWILLEFLEFVEDDAGRIFGAKYLINLGHGYGFNPGYKKVILKLNEEFVFDHEYTDTSDGTWKNESSHIVVRLVKR